MKKWTLFLVALSCAELIGMLVLYGRWKHATAFGERLYRMRVLADLGKNTAILNRMNAGNSSDAQSVLLVVISNDVDLIHSEIREGVALTDEQASVLRRAEDGLKGKAR